MLKFPELTFWQKGFFYLCKTKVMKSFFCFVWFALVSEQKNQSGVGCFVNQITASVL
jgi:hypothetical protein